MPSRSRRGGRRSWTQRTFIAVNAMAMISAALTAGALAYSNDRVASVPRKTFSTEILAGTAGSEEPQNFLLIGIDDTLGIPEGDSAYEKRSVELTDTIIILRLDPKSVSAQMLSFPRDLLVQIPGQPHKDRINKAFELGGPSLVIRTIKSEFDIPIHHYIGLNFAGFRKVVELVGGIPVHFPRPARSRSTVEFKVSTAGCWVLGPRMALGFARTRKDYQVQDSKGKWHVDLGGDYSRVNRQQLLVELALRQAIAKGARNVNTLRRLLDAGLSSVSIDETFEPEDVVDLSRRFRSFDPSELVTLTLPVDEAETGPDYLYLREDEAETTFELFRGESNTGDPVEAADVTVRVRNGTGIMQQATQVTKALTDAGFNTTDPGLSGSPGFPTMVQYARGSESEAQIVMSWIDSPGAVYQVGSLPKGLNVILVTGDGWKKIRAAPLANDAVPKVAEQVGTTSPTTAPLEVPAATTPVEATDDTAKIDASTDPDDPNFYKAHAPGAGAQCQKTP